MNKLYLHVLGVLLVSSCRYTIPPAYQKERSPESRDEYNGAEGMIQYQRDQSYLMRKSRCEQANKDLVIELENSSDKEKIKEFKQQVK